MNTTGPRLPAVAISEDDEDMIVNEYDNPDGFVVSEWLRVHICGVELISIVDGTLPTAYDQGVHSLTGMTRKHIGCQHYSHYRQTCLFSQAGRAAKLSVASVSCCA